MAGPLGKESSVFVVHGFGEHGGRYLHLPHYVREQADSVYCLDLRGHGRSEGLRGHVEDFDDLTDDLAHALRRRAKHENHLVAHSLGAIVALRALHFYPDLPVHSLTISAPCFALREELVLGRELAAGMLARLWGSCHLDARLDPAKLSRNAEVVEAYRRDRLVHSRITPRFYAEMKAAMRDTLRHCGDIRVPVLMMVPMDDPIVNPDVSVRFFNELQIKDRQIQMYRGFYHEPFNENGKETPFEDLRSWLIAHRAHSPFSSRS